MPNAPQFNLLIATDGSPQARAAVAATVLFPWPRQAHPTVIVASGGSPFRLRLATAAAELRKAHHRVAARAVRALQARWAAPEAAVVDQPPAEAILAWARELPAHTVVLGFRGLNALSRIVLGSVSRAVLRDAACPVLVVKRRPRRLRRFVVGVDGSTNSRRALQFLERLSPVAGREVELVQVVEPVRVVSVGLLPKSVRDVIATEASELHAQRVRAAEQALERGQRALARRGFQTQATVRTGVPLPELLRAVADRDGDVLVLGARGVSGIERALLGSVAEGALAQSPVSLLVVK